MKNIVKSFLNDKGGNFAIIFALTAAPVIGAAAMAVDYAGYKRMDTRMYIATEAAMLAASKHVVYMREQDYAADGDYDMTNAEIVAELDTVFKPFFEANFAAGGYELTSDQYTLEYIEADNNTKVLVTMIYDTAVMKAFGTSEMISTREMIINLKVQPNNYVIDIVMCIDATGSMQNTLTAVKNKAMAFNGDLREELGVGPQSEKVKIRVRPIFYRDWEEGRTYQNAIADYEDDYDDYLEDLAAYEEAMAGGDDGSSAVDEQLEEYIEEWEDGNWYYKNGSRWKKSNRSWKPKTHKRIKLSRNNYAYFESIDDLVEWYEGSSYASSGSSGSGGGTYAGDPPVPPTMPINHGLNMYPDFIDLDPNGSTGVTQADKNTELTTFLGSTSASGGGNWPEAAGACMNEAIRSNWYDNQSAEAKEYFKVEPGDVIIRENDTIPSASYTKITPIPVVVFWSDAPINDLNLSRQYLSATTPTSWNTFESLWNGSIPNGDPSDTHGVAANSSGRPVIDTDYRMMLHFGPSSGSGFNTMDTWDKVYYGGSLSTGNSEAVKVIARKILEAIPDLLRVGS